MLTPMDDRILISMMEEKTPSGIIIPDTAKQSSSIGIVVEVGKDIVGVSKGDKVLLSKHGMDGFAYNGEDYKIVTKNHILVKIDDRQIN
jgi:chaperonin GroES